MFLNSQPAGQGKYRWERLWQRHGARLTGLLPRGKSIIVKRAGQKPHRRFLPSVYLVDRIKATKAAYMKLLRKQKGRCALCRGKASGRWRVLNLDHDHKTDRVRGLLCVKCNVFLGWFEKYSERVNLYLKGD